MSDAAIELRDIQKRYGRRTVLDVPQFVFATGGQYEITGANGSGKSTLLRLIAGVTLPSRGQVLWHLPRKDGGIAFVPQSGGYLPSLSLAENAVAIASTLGSWARCLLDEPDTLEAFGLRDQVRRPMAQLSEGTRRLVVLLAAISTKPQLLIADEPFAGIDQSNEAKLRDHLRRTRLGGAVTIMSTHEAPEGASTVKVANGRLLQ